MAAGHKFVTLEHIAPILFHDFFSFAGCKSGWFNRDLLNPSRREETAYNALFSLGSLYEMVNQNTLRTSEVTQVILREKISSTI